MKILIIVLAILFQNVLSDKKAEVLQSFSETFDSIHKELTFIQTTTHGSANEIFKHLKVVTNTTEQYLKVKQEEARNNVSHNIQTYSKGGHNPINQEDETCFSEAVNSVAEMNERSNTALKICKSHSAERLGEINSVLNKLYLKHETEHKDLEEVKNYCNSITEDVQQMYDCLYNHLYQIHAYKINQMKEESADLLQKYYYSYDESEKDLLKCSVMVTKNLFGEADAIIRQFKNCQASAKHTMYNI